MSIVKRQHYVWRHYLRPWAENDNIWTYFTQLKKIEKTSLMGVAQERYFYKLVDFTDAEETFLKNYIEKFSPSLVKSLNFDFLNLFTSTSKLKKSLDETINPAIDKEKYAEEIRKLEINLMEIGHGKIENLGHKLIALQSLEDLKTIEQDDYLFEAIMFLCFQYFRTKSMRKSALQPFIGGEYEELAKKSWNILSYVSATTVAKNISLDPKLKFIFHENNTTEQFITCDQPVFNILNDKTDEKGEVTHLEFYYPISPKKALTIHFREEQTEKFIGNNADKELVDYFNKKVIENSDFYVFADNKEQLERLK